MLKQLISYTAWRMIPPKAYGSFHILFTVIGFALCAVLAIACRRLSEKAHRRLLLSLGLFLAGTELYKQLFYYYYIGNCSYQWWIFPFQLCSVPMYLCIIAALIPKGRVQRGIYAFMSTFNMLGGAIAFAEPSGLCHPYVTLTAHAFVWHMLLVFIGFYLIASGRGCYSAADFGGAVATFLALCVIALGINVGLWDISGGSVNMFFIGPANTTLVVFKDIAQEYGWYVATALYIPVVCIGAAIVWGVTRVVRYFCNKHKHLALKGYKHA